VVSEEVTGSNTTHYYISAIHEEGTG